MRKATADDGAGISRQVSGVSCSGVLPRPRRSASGVSRDGSRMFLQGGATRMAIADTVWERLARFNAPHRGRSRRQAGLHVSDGAAQALRGLGLACVWLIVGLSAIANLLTVLGVWLGRHGLRLLCGGARFALFCLLPAPLSVPPLAGPLCWWRLPRLPVSFRLGLVG